MTTVRDIIFKPDGFVAFLTDNTKIHGTFRLVQGQLRITGVSAAQKTLLQSFYTSHHPSLDSDIRFFAAISGGGGGAPGAPGPPGSFNFQEDEFSVGFGGQTAFVLSETFIALRIFPAGLLSLFLRVPGEGGWSPIQGEGYHCIKIGKRGCGYDDCPQLKFHLFPLTSK